MSNQRGDNIGFATAYGFKEKLQQDPRAAKGNGKSTKASHSLNRQITIKKTIDLIGDYYGEKSTKQVESQKGQKMKYNTKDTVYQLDTTQDRAFQSLSQYEKELDIERQFQAFA